MWLSGEFWQVCQTACVFVGNQKQHLTKTLIRIENEQEELIIDI